MRAHIKAGDKWVIEELPSDPMGLYRWLCKHDGEQVVVADDEHKVYYCAREKELELYREKGKKAEMFIVLADLLWANMPDPAEL